MPSTTICADPIGAPASKVQAITGCPPVLVRASRRFERRCLGTWQRTLYDLWTASS